MKRSCKHIDITNPDTIYPYVYDCISRHGRRYDFARLLNRYGVTYEQYSQYYTTYDIAPLEFAIRRIAEEVAIQIARRELRLPPVIIRQMIDKTTGKERQIGKESAMQQVFDYVAVGASQEIWDRRIVPHQASSIVGRGQIYGKNMIQKWIKEDNRAAKYARTHGRRYSRKCKYFVKLDIKKCFPSMSVDVFMKFFRRDCANEDLLWLWERLLRSHQVNGYTGFMIGALPSQWGAQYLMTFVYRYAMDLHVMRRDNRVRLVTHMIQFMDDFLLTGSSRSNLKKAVHQLISWVHDELGLVIKSTWTIYEVSKVSIDMMGYVVHKSGKATIRGRDYIRSRRIALRIESVGSACLRQAKRMMSYKGYFRFTSSRDVTQMLNLHPIFSHCSRVISHYAREESQCGLTMFSLLTLRSRFA